MSQRTFLPVQELLNPEPWQRIAAALQKPASLDQSTLDYFEQLTKWCWHLSNGNDLGAVEQLVASYLPKVSLVAQRPSEHQRQAAGIASQGYQLTYVITSQREDFNAALSACKQAHYYGTLAYDPNLQAAALIRQGVTYLNRKRPYQTLASYQEATLLVPALSPLLQTRLYAGMAEVQGKLQQEQDALTSIRQSHNSFPDHPENDPAAIYIHFNHSSVFLHEGLALLDLHQPVQAAKALERIDGLHPKMTISERSRIDVLNQQALAAGQQGDLDQFGLYMEQAIVSARKLGSDLRISEAWDIHTRMRDQWKYEPRMQSLGNLFAR